LSRRAKILTTQIALTSKLIKYHKIILKTKITFLKIISSKEVVSICGMAG